MNSTESGPPPPKPPMAGLAHGLQFAVTVFLGLAAGYWLDGRYGWSPVGTLLGFFGGAALGMYQLARAFR